MFFGKKKKPKKKSESFQFNSLSLGSLEDIPSLVNVDDHFEKISSLATTSLRSSSNALKKMSESQTDKELKEDLLWESKWLSHHANCVEYISEHKKLCKPWNQSKYDKFNDMFKPKEE